MFKVGEFYMIRFAAGDGEKQMQCKILEEKDHLIKIQGRYSDEEPRIVNTASRNFLSAHWIDASKEPVPVDMDSLVSEGRIKESAGYKVELED